MRNKTGEDAMGKKILQINLKYNVSTPDLKKAFLEVAPQFAEVKGLLWKIWMINNEDKTGGGIYLFEDDASVKAYLDSELVAGLMKHPALSDIEAKVFDILVEHTKITSGPI